MVSIWYQDFLQGFKEPVNSTTVTVTFSGTAGCSHVSEVDFSFSSSEDDEEGLSTSLLSGVGVSSRWLVSSQSCANEVCFSARSCLTSDSSLTAFPELVPFSINSLSEDEEDEDDDDLELDLMTVLVTNMAPVTTFTSVSLFSKVEKQNYSKK